MARGKKLPKVLPGEEKESLLSQLNPRYQASLRNLCVIRVMLEAGLRAGEVVALKPEHLNMLSLKLIVREGKGAKDRTLWINANLRDMIGKSGLNAA